MTYIEAENLYGTLIRPVDAADLIGVHRSAINDYWKRGVLKKIIVTIGEKEKNFVIKSEVNQYIKKREEKSININGNNNIVANNGNITIKK